MPYEWANEWLPLTVVLFVYLLGMAMTKTWTGLCNQMSSVSLTLWWVNDISRKWQTIGHNVSMGKAHIACSKTVRVTRISLFMVVMTDHRKKGILIVPGISRVWLQPEYHTVSCKQPYTFKPYHLQLYLFKSHGWIMYWRFSFLLIFYKKHFKMGKWFKLCFKMSPVAISGNCWWVASEWST